MPKKKKQKQKQKQKHNSLLTYIVTSKLCYALEEHRLNGIFIFKPLFRFTFWYGNDLFYLNQISFKMNGKLWQFNMESRENLILKES